MRIATILGCVGLLLGLVSPSLAQTLKEGSTAPPIKVAKWLKGTPIEKFESGKVYVVEFWATWCGPCRQTIPHLTKIAKKYQDKVTVIGVSIWERVGADKVEEFVRTMGDKMEYHVALDDGDTMATTWMEAAGQDGIPTAFVVDQTGKIVWIGHPMAGLEEVLDAVLAGKWDWQAYARQREEQERAQREMFQTLERIGALIQEGKREEAIRELDKLAEKYPDFRMGISRLRFQLLLAHDEKRAYAYARELMNGDFKDSPDMLNALAWAIVGDDRPFPLKEPDYDLGLALAQRAVELSKEQDPSILDTLAHAHYRKGNYKQAVETQRKAVALAEKDPDYPKELLEQLRENLKKFEKAAEDK